MAKVMTKAGYKMNHATARNQLILAIESLLNNTSSKLKIDIPQNDIKDLIDNQEFQDNLGDVLYLAHEKMMSEEKE